MLKEFREFIMRGNVMDMAIGIVIGGAFSTIINSVVADILMPIIGFLTAGINFTDLSITLGDKVVLTYGNLIQAVINFLIIALFIFLMVKSLNKLSRKKEEAVVEEEPKKSAEVLLLEEIRDELRKDK